MQHHDPEGLQREKSRSDAPGNSYHSIRVSRRGCLLILLITAGCNPAPAPPEVLVTTITSSSDSVVLGTPEQVTRISYGTEVFRDAINSFVVVEEVSDLPAMHLPSRWVHLSWDTPDRRVNITLTDEGAKLYVSAQSSECSSSVHPLQYQGSEDESGLYADMVTALEAVVDSCGRRMQGAGQYLRLLERAEAEFPRAMRAMKARVVPAFGRNMSRCRLPAPDKVLDPNRPCS